MRLVFLHVVTPLHVGMGQVLGGVELPVARQKATKFPWVPGSSLKGSLRAKLAAHGDVERIFGSEHGEEGAGGRRGAVIFGDAQLLVLPVRSSTHTFVWLTCDTLLRQVKRLGLELGEPSGKQSLELEGGVKVDARAGTDALAELVAKVIGGSNEAPQKRRERVARRLFVVDDDDFAWATELATQVDVRVRIDSDTRTVVKSALWAEESLAPETVLVAPVDVVEPSDDIGALTSLRAVTLGGKNTVGRGVCRLSWEGTA